MGPKEWRGRWRSGTMITRSVESKDRPNIFVLPTTPHHSLHQGSGRFSQTPDPSLEDLHMPPFPPPYHLAAYGVLLCGWRYFPCPYVWAARRRFWHPVTGTGPGDFRKLAVL